jgi:pimeloyl-ACP methyl ester carboxylesterase
MRTSSLLRTVVAVVATATALIAIGTAAAWWLVRPVEPDAFYQAPTEMPAQPGHLLRQEAFARGIPPGAQAWRILYTTTDAGGVPALASALVMRSRTAPDGPLPVVAWTHGTTGVAAGCAPSLLAEPLAHVPALAEMLEQHWLFVAPDYIGLGAAGPHSYLIGSGEARSALDAVRAARRMRDVQADERTVVWGHSQGGHAALWTGILAPGYARDVRIAGVAAAAPASDLLPLIEHVQHTLVGRIMTAFVLRAYADAYAEVSVADYAGGPLARLLAQDMARRCLAGRQALFSVAEALLLGGSLFASPPAAGALGARLAENTPVQPIRSPVLIAQGESDELVLPAIQLRWVERRCAQGEAIEFRRYPGRDHLSLVAADSPFSADLVAWTRSRFAGVPAPAHCAPQLPEAEGGSDDPQDIPSH